MRTALRHLRHGPLKRYNHIWLSLGKAYHAFTKRFSFLMPPAKQKIGPYGPFRFHPCFAFSAFHQWGGHHNAGFVTSVEYSRDKKCVFDIGAHIGLVSMPISQMIAPDGIIYAFEPADANRRYLEYHLQKNHIKNVKVVSSLVGNSNNEINFYEMDSDTGMNSVVPMQHQGDFKPSTKSQITLDHFCEAHQAKPDLIKIDVEGYELAVLQGAQKTLKNNDIAIFLSVHPTHLQKLGHSADELKQFIESIDYQITELDGSPVTTFALSEYLVQPNRKIV